MELKKMQVINVQRAVQEWGISMKIGEAQKLYSSQVHKLYERKMELTKQHKENEKNNNFAANEGVILELNSINEKYDKAKEFMKNFNAYRDLLEMAESSKQADEAVEEATEDLVKIMEIARRISSGAKVPAYDEQKLMEYNFKLYLAAKNAAMINESDEEYDSLYDDEEEDGQKEKPSEIVDNMECSMQMPSDIEITSVE